MRTSELFVLKKLTQFFRKLLGLARTSDKGRGLGQAVGTRDVSFLRFCRTSFMDGLFFK